MNQKTRTFKKIKIPGGEVIQRFIGIKGQRPITIPKKEIPLLKSKGPVLFISDTHLGIKRFKRSSYKRLWLMRDVLNKYPQAPVILGGDFLEYCFNKPKHLKKLMESRRSRNLAEELWLQVLDILERRQVFLLPGNHDPEDWYKRSKWIENTNWVVAKFMILEVAKSRILLTHGDDLYEEIDKTFFQGIRNMHFSIVKLMRIWENTCLKFMGDRYLKYKDSRINRSVENVIDSWKEAFGVDKVLMGHSHYPHESHDAGFYVAGVFSEFYRSYAVIDAKSRISIHPRKIKFNEYLEYQKT